MTLALYCKVFFNTLQWLHEDADETRDLGGVKGGGGITTPAVSKKLVWRRQMSPAEAEATVIPLVAQGSDNSLVLQLLIGLSSCMSATEEYITQQKGTDAIQSPARLVQTGAGTLQPSCRGESQQLGPIV